MPAAAGERALLWAVLLCAALVSLVSLLLGAWLLFRRRDLLGRGRTAVLPRVVVAGLLIGISVLSVLPDALDALVAAGWRTEAVLLCGSAAPPAPRPPLPMRVLSRAHVAAPALRGTGSSSAACSLSSR